MGGPIKADPEDLTALGARYGHYFKVESVPELLERFGLRIGEPLSGGWTPLTSQRQDEKPLRPAAVAGLRPFLYRE